jgi:hypothetical protein
VTLWSGLDTQSKHDAFTANPSLASATEGRDAQLRTNILGVVTVAAAIATAFVGIFAVKWSRAPAAAVGGRY